MNAGKTINVNEKTKVYDLIGLGAGPFNLSVAALAEKTQLDSLFFEKKQKCEWHSGMQIDDAKIQNSHLRDLVSLADPTNQYSFTNFLHENGRLEIHLIANFSNILRKEFEQYLQWVSEKLGNIIFSHEAISIDECNVGFKVIIRDIRDGTLHEYKAKNIVLGIGPKPVLPSFSIREVNIENVFHNSKYNENKYLTQGKHVTIIGGGQSGLEVMQDLLNLSEAPSRITLIDKQPFIPQIEDSQFAENVVFSSVGVDKFYKINSDQKDYAIKDFRITSDGASPSTIERLYQELYFNALLSKDNIDVSIMHGTSVDEIKVVEGAKLEMELSNNSSDNRYLHKSDIVILATGYRQVFPENIFSSKIVSNIVFHDNGLPIVNQNYDIEYNKTGNIYVVNGAKHSHGVADPNLSLSAIRASKIVNHCLSDDFYKVNCRYVYKDFELNKNDCLFEKVVE